MFWHQCTRLCISLKTRLGVQAPGSTAASTLKENDFNATGKQKQTDAVPTHGVNVVFGAHACVSMWLTYQEWYGDMLGVIYVVHLNWYYSLVYGFVVKVFDKW